MQKANLKLFFASIAFFSLYGTCAKTDTSQNNNGGNNPGIQAALWQTSGDKSHLLVNVQHLTLTEGFSNIRNLPVVDVDITQTYQSVDGFGASLTQSSAYVLNKNLNAANRTALLKELFSKTGIGVDNIRICIGASDFSYTGDYSYNNTNGDTLMNTFSIDMEKANLLPILKEIVEINPQIRILASPWSPPAWMKTSNSMEDGHLKPKYYRAYARYFVKYIKAMKTEGINIDAVTCQNEPLYGSANYPCMFMFAPEQRDFIRDHLGPLFKQNNINAKIILYDHNWDRPLYADTILQDTAARQYVAGTGFHAYGGTVEAMNRLHALQPDKDLYFTEQSGGNWAPDFSDNLKWFTENLIIGTTRCWSKNVLLWNLALDENHGPQNHGCSDCRGVVTVASNGTITRNEEYYILGHAGKFVQQNARRCYSYDMPSQNIRDVAFLNPDQSRVLLLMNTSLATKSIVVKEKTRACTVEIQPNAVYSMYWK